jgi:hypothetical protein
MSFDAPLPPYNASDPTATFLNSSCLDLLMIELVPMAYRVVNEVDSGADFALVKSQPEADRKAEAERERREGREGQDGNVNGNGRKMDEDEERDAVFFRLEMLGYRVGQGLVERYVFSHSFRIEE